MSICEGCMAPDAAYNLSESAILDDSLTSYFKMFSMCFNLDIPPTKSDPHTHYICSLCALRLIDAAKFRNQVERTQTRLVQTLKTEIEDNNEEIEPSIDRSVVSPSSSADDTLLPVKKEDHENISNTKIEERKFNNKKKLQSTAIKSEQTHLWIKIEDRKPKGKHAKRLDNETPKKKNKLPMNPETLTCTLCQKKFENILVLQRHMAEHFPEHLCDVCGNVYRKLDHLRIHLRTHTTVQCKQCSKMVKETALKKHLERHHNSEKRYYMCSTCYEKFKTVTDKRKHMFEMHGSDIGGKCKECNKIFAAKSNLRMHIRAVHCKEVNVFCQQCGKGFLNSYALKRHMSKHTGVRNHVCHICRKAYLKKDTLTAHMRIHKSEKDFVCSLCAKAFTYKCSLKGHMKAHHPYATFEG